MLHRLVDLITSLKLTIICLAAAMALIFAGTLAQVHLGASEYVLAEQQARHALELLGERPDFLDEIGNAQIVLGRALLEQGRLDEAGTVFDQAEASLTQLSSASHAAVAWTAQGDLALRRNDVQSAAILYRRAAEALQDVRF
jgi:tetratricopeptide (TPR) repeat protein